VADAELVLRGPVTPDLRREGTRAAVLSGWPSAVVVLAVGVALIFVATMTLDDGPMWLRWLLGLGGVLLTSRGIDVLAKHRFGPGFQTGFWLAASWVGLIVVLAVLAPVLPLEKPGYLPLSSPSYLRPNLFSSYPLGTDGFGRDYVSRLVWGARVSLIVGVGCTAVGLAIGTGLGVVAGYYKGRVEVGLNLLTDFLLAFPPLVFLLALVAVLRPSLRSLFFAFALLTVPTIIRLSKANTLVFAQRDFVLAARALGARHRRIVFREVLPNVLRPLLSYSMVIVASLIVAEASLSFLGLGIKAPTPSWGNMIAESQTVIQQDPHAILVPAIVLFLTVFSFNRLGEAGRARRETRQSVLT
jgi:peptide/nickel transport system permease protein